MDQVRVRLVYPGFLSERYVRAAQEGLRSFEKFGALVENRCAMDGAAFRGLRYPGLVRRIALAEHDIHFSRLKRPHDHPWNAFGIAITPHFLLLSDDTMDRFSGFAGYQTLGVVSLAVPLRLEEPGPAITAMVKCQAGRLLIPLPDEKEPPGPDNKPAGCHDDCLMQPIGGFFDFVDRVVARDLDFCEACKGAISRTIVRLSHGMN